MEEGIQIGQEQPIFLGPYDFHDMEIWEANAEFIKQNVKSHRIFQYQWVGNDTEQC